MFLKKKKLWYIIVCRNGSFQEIQQRLLDNYSDNLLIHYNKSKPLTKIELKHYSREINYKPYPWVKQDKKEFIMHINEMKQYDLIRESISGYSSPMMIVIKHSEKKEREIKLMIVHIYNNRIYSFHCHLYIIMLTIKTRNIKKRINSKKKENCLLLMQATENSLSI